MKLTPIASNMTELELNDGTRVLFSYSTPVAVFRPGSGWGRTATYYSKTTSGHINKWARLHGVSIPVAVSQTTLDDFIATKG